jgi:hypothetical protein
VRQKQNVDPMLNSSMPAPLRTYVNPGFSIIPLFLSKKERISKKEIATSKAIEKEISKHKQSFGNQLDTLLLGIPNINHLNE